MSLFKKQKEEEIFTTPEVKSEPVFEFKPEELRFKRRKPKKVELTKEEREALAGLEISDDGSKLDD